MRTLLVIAILLLMLWNIIVSAVLIALTEAMRKGDYCKEYCPYKKSIENEDI